MRAVDGVDGYPSVTTEIHDAGHNVVTTVPLGTTVHDRAASARSAASHQPAASTSPSTRTAPAPARARAPAPSPSTAAASPIPRRAAARSPRGAYSFRAHYGGDANYLAGDGPCETLTVTAATPTVTSDVHDAGHNVVTNGSARDDRPRPGRGRHVAGFTPTGSVDFAFYANGTCTGGGSSAGTVAIDGSGVAHPSQSRGPLAAGAYSFRAHYNGDANYLAGDSAMRAANGDGRNTDRHD